MLRQHWTRRRKLRDYYIWEIILQRGTPGTGFDKAVVSIVRYGVRMLDPDNLVGSMKLVIDALRVAHIIKDDDSDHIELDVKQEKVKHLKDQRVEIEVKEL